MPETTISQQSKPAAPSAIPPGIDRLERDHRRRIPTAGWIAIALVAVVGAGAFLIGPRPDKGPSTSAEAVAAS